MSFCVLHLNRINHSFHFRSFSINNGVVRQTRVHIHIYILFSLFMLSALYDSKHHLNISTANPIRVKCLLSLFLGGQICHSTQTLELTPTPSNFTFHFKLTSLINITKSTWLPQTDRMQRLYWGHWHIHFQIFSANNVQRMTCEWIFAHCLARRKKMKSSMRKYWIHSWKRSEKYTCIRKRITNRYRILLWFKYMEKLFWRAHNALCVIGCKCLHQSPSFTHPLLLLK